MYLLLPALAQIDNGATMNAVGKYKPLESQKNALQYLSYISEHIHEGTLGSDIPLNMTKEDVQNKYGIKDEEITSATWNTSYFDRNGYRYYLQKHKGKQLLLTISVQFEPLTKEQIFEIFGNKPYLNSNALNQMVYKFDDYSIMITNTDPKIRGVYNLILLSSGPPKEN